MKDHLQANLDRAFRFARYILGDPQRAEDAVQEACLRCLRQPPRSSDEEAARSYFLRAVKNTALDMAESDAARSRREEAVMTPAGPGAAAPELAAAERELGRAARQELGRLPREVRTAISLCCEEGLTHREAAEILGLPRTTVSDCVRRGLEELRKVLEARGFGVAAPAALVGALAHTAPAAPATLRAAVTKLVATGTAAHGSGPAAAATAASKEGLIVKIGLGMAAVGIVAGTAVWSTAGKSGEQAAQPTAAAAPASQRPSKFSTPVWSPGAEWEEAGDWAGTGISSNLDGPRQEVMWRSNFSSFEDPLVYMPSGGPYPFSCYDAGTGRLHAVSGGARGLLDGPLIRARYGGKNYGLRPDTSFSPDRRFYVFTDPGNRGAVRVMDLKEQTVRTALPGGSGTQALTVDSKGRILILARAGRLLIVDAATLKTIEDITLKSTEGIDLGGFSCGIALDEKNNRLYATGCIRFNQGRPGAAGGKPLPWHVWYFDLNDGGIFHGLLAGKLTGPNGGYAGPFDGYEGYGEGKICFGPDDPDYRFIYMNRTDTATFVRLDVEKRVVAACSGAPKGKTGPVAFVEQGAPNKTVSHLGPIWLPGGDFIMPGLREGPAPYFRRVK